MRWAVPEPLPARGRPRTPRREPLWMWPCCGTSSGNGANASRRTWRGPPQNRRAGMLTSAFLCRCLRTAWGWSG
eukprot:4895162-Prorocentrum_lima.AAC.1